MARPMAACQWCTDAYMCHETVLHGRLIWSVEFGCKRKKSGIFGVNTPLEDANAKANAAVYVMQVITRS